MTESTHISFSDIDLEAAAVAFGSGNKKPAEKGNGAGALENVDLTIAATGMDFPGAMALINGLTFEAMHPELTATSVPDAGEDLPDWLKSSLDEPEPPVLFPEEPVLDGPTAEEARAGLQAAEAAGAGTQVLNEGEVVVSSAAVEKKRWDSIKQGLSSYLETHWKEMFERGVGVAVGAVLGRVVEGSPWVRAGLGMALVATSVRSRIMDNSGRIGQFIETRKSLHPEFYKSKNLAERAIALVVEAEMRVFQGGSWLIERPALEGIGWGLVLEGVIDGLTPDKQAAQMGQAEVGDGNIGGDYYHGTSDANLPQPQEITQGNFDGLQPSADVATANEATQAAQAAAQQAEAVAQQAAEQAATVAAQTAEVARIAALQQGPTVAELAAQMPKQTVSEAIYQMIGDVPHRGEVTNILFRAIGDKVNNLNEGAIKAAADALRPVFENIDQVMVVNSGTTYTEGGRAVVEVLKGFNSPEAQAIRAANMADLEAAGNLFNNVIGPVIK